MKNALPESQFRKISNNIFQQAPKHRENFAAKQLKTPPGELFSHHVWLCQENFEFKPLSQAKLDTHYPYPLPTKSNEQMGTYPFTLTHPKFLVGNTHYLPTHPQNRWVKNPACISLVRPSSVTRCTPHFFMG